MFSIHATKPYSITKSGTESLQAARELQHNLWKNIPDFSLVEKKT